jgi:hypothetical protein
VEAKLALGTGLLERTMFDDLQQSHVVGGDRGEQSQSEARKQHP